MGLTSLSREIFEVFARPMSPCLEFNALFGGPLGKLPQNADGWRNFYGWKPKRRYFSSSKMGTPARRVANPHASSKPPARETDTREKGADSKPADRMRFSLVANLRLALAEDFSGLHEAVGPVRRR